MRLLFLFFPLLIGSCTVRVEQAALATTKVQPHKIAWPKWTPTTLHKGDHRNPFMPEFVQVRSGEVITYGPRSDDSEHFAILSKRTENAKQGLFPMPQCFLPTSMFAGTSPLLPTINELVGPNRKWFYPTADYRSTFFDFYPSKTQPIKGLLVYHTSIMLLSTAEKEVIKKFRAKGWNILVGLPPDSLYRTRIPALSSPKGTLANAAKLIAEDMDRHYLEQARTTEVALEYLARRNPSYLQGKRVLMGTSAGTFGMPAEALMNPGWDALVFVSGGTNLLSLYESGSAGLFSDSLKWLADARKNPPTEVTRIFTDEEYHEIYRQAAKLTRFHSGALAPRIQNQRILMIAGTIDHIMPDVQAHGLYQALGRPERWTAPLGHHLIAIQLIFEVDRIDRWIMNPKPAKKTS